MILRELFVSCWRFSENELSRILADYESKRFTENYDLFVDEDCHDDGMVYLFEDIQEILSNKLYWYNQFLIWLNCYLHSIPVSASFKQKLWERVTDWAIAIGNKLEIEEPKTLVMDSVIQPVSGDLTLRMVKELQNRDGVTKEMLAGIFDRKEKTIQNELARLRSTPERESSFGEARICGQIVRVPITCREKLEEDSSGYRRYKRYYHTPNSMHPLFLQMNVSQVGTILTSLEKSYYEEEKNLAIDIALEIWCQLTEYGRERVKIAFVDSSTFWDELDAEMLGERAPHFSTERELSDRMSKWELLTMHCKLGHDCTIRLHEDGGWKTYNHYRIIREQNRQGEWQFVAVPSEKHTGKENRMDRLIISENTSFEIDG